MSKTGFRRIDVDQYDEEKFKDDQVEQEDGGPDEQEVSQYLMSGNNLQALRACLQSPPYRSRNSSIKGNMSKDIVEFIQKIALKLKYIQSSKSYFIKSKAFVSLYNVCIAEDRALMEENATLLLLRVLAAIKNSEIPNALNSLSIEELDVLMKYIYKGFSLGLDGQQCGYLLNWHEKVSAKGGMGCIIRVLADRKRL